MSRFNLLDEPWIRVVNISDGQMVEVSLIDLFRHSENYLCLAGEMETQDFAVLRILLAVLHTVFSRVDADGIAYSYLELGEKFVPTEEIHPDDKEDYEEALLKTWTKLWEKGSFPSIIEEYLYAWRDHFYLLDEDFPFMQVKADDISGPRINQTRPSSISGKTINRLISESGNKVALFSPKSDKGNNKESLSYSEVARWLLTYQGYCGLSDKTTFNIEKTTWSKGWLFDLGGIYFSGKNLFETLMLNLVLVHPKGDFNLKQQAPSWEFDSSDLLDDYLSGRTVDNLASLYTTWSRAVYIDSSFTENKPFEMYVVKLPEMDHVNPEIEPMTLWRVSTDEKDKGKFSPRKHNANISLWRSFGLITLPNSTEEGQKQVTLISWLSRIEDIVGDMVVTLHSISMEDDGNATSWLPNGEIADSLHLSDYLLTDVAANGWVARINDVVEKTKVVISNIYRKYLRNIAEVRNIDSRGFLDQGVSEMYFHIDIPFREWLESITKNSNKEDTVNEWYSQLYKICNRQAEKVLANSGTRVSLPA